MNLVEIAIGLMALIPIMLVVFDLCLIALGTQINDSTCREAARVAAIGSPTDAQARAQAIIAKANSTASNMVSNFKLVQFTSTITPQDIAKLGTYGGQLHGDVTVQTDVTIHSFVVQWVSSGGNAIHLRSQQTFPATYVVPNTTQLQPG